MGKRGPVGFTCRHDVTPRSACKLCKAEDARMRRAATRKPPKAPLATRRARLIEENRRLLAEDEALKNKSPTT